MTENKGILTFYLSKSHPDYHIARNQSNEGRRLYNTLNKLKSEKSKLRKDPNTQTPVANSLNVDLGKDYAEAWRKRIEQSQGIVLAQKLAQHVGKQVDQVWNSIIFKRSNRLKANDPKYKKNYCEIRFTKQAFSHSKNTIKKNVILPTGWNSGFKLPKEITLLSIESLLLVPRPDGFELKVLYKKDAIKQADSNTLVYAGGDIGLDKLITIISTDGSRPKTVNGKSLKSLNRYFNKRVGNLKSIRDRLSGVCRGGERDKLDKEIRRLWYKRDRQINHFLNSASNEVVRYLQGIGVHEFVIGWSSGFKKNINIGRVNNQNFSAVPHARFRDILIRKCAEAGINVIIQEESYTSKASFIDSDFIPVFNNRRLHYSFSGVRVSRGNYRSYCGGMIHADVNGAWNILRKCKPSIGWSSGVVGYPENLKIVF